MNKKEWFAEWFDTSYYHTLYQNRNDEEAEQFISNLHHFLQLESGSKVLDLACGKGRHSVTLNKLGLDVLGVDLSPNSISDASQFSTEGLMFEVHDMREVIPNKHFDAIFNLFTSFGYFDEITDNDRVIKAIRSMLREEGILVIDFMNAVRIIASLVTEEEKELDGIVFKINREYDGKHIYKHIRFEDQGQSFHFTERVQALKQHDFIELLTQNKFEIIRTFGDFDLHPFEENTSDRLIIIARKI
jgi:cyclopropane fatty-acyl-phospholipid synthase-like methyltransferase